MLQRIGLVGSLLIPTAAMAHEGHGVSGVLHYIAEPIHVLPVLALVGVAWLVLRQVKKNRS